METEFGLSCSQAAFASSIQVSSSLRAPIPCHVGFRSTCATRPLARRLERAGRFARGIPVPCLASAAQQTPAHPATSESAEKVSKDDSEALVAGIKAVAIGKHGVKPVPADIVPAIDNALCKAHDLAESSRDGKALSELERDVLLQRASLLGSLFVKAEISPDEMRLLQVAVRPETKRAAAVGRVRRLGDDSISAGQILTYITMFKYTNASPGGVERALVPLISHALQLLGDEAYTVERAQDLGKLIYSAENNTITVLQLKALVAHVMRIRHETSDELVGLAHAANCSIHPDFLSSRPGTPVAYSQDTGRQSGRTALIAEPFDGVLTWDLVTPILARHLRTRHGLDIVFSTGASSGPKYGPNLRDLAHELKVPFAKSASDLTDLLGRGDVEFGIAIDQRDYSPGLDAWVTIRRAIVKRPALATVEKFCDVVPGGASIFIASAFHPAYVDKMAAVAEARGYPGYVILSKGVEGSTGVGIGSKSRAALLTGARGANGNYTRKEFFSKSSSDENQKTLEAPEKGSATLERTVTRIRTWIERGTSGDDCFDHRVRSTLETFDAALTHIL